MADVPPPMMLVEPGTVRRVPLAPHAMTAAITPVADLFMLAHLGVVRAAAPEDWTLLVDGMVAAPLRLTLRDLAALPQRRVTAVHQCAGNPLAPTVPTRRVACVTWGGVALADVLARVGVDPGARFVWSDGADQGDFGGEHVPFYRKDLPLDRAGADVLLATHLNGEALPAAHGGPLRLVVPGFFGTNSVKWLWRLTLAEHRAEGLFTTRFYNDARDDGATRPVWALAPEAVFVTPAPDATVGGSTLLRGWAWSDAPVNMVAISDDLGAHWFAADLAPRQERGWQEWTAFWTPRRGGDHTLWCRATDAAGAVQPLEGARNAIHAVPVYVA